MLKRILIAYIGISISLFLALGILVANKSSSSIKEELLNTAEISMDESYRSIINIISSAKDTSLEIAINSNVQEALQLSESDYDNRNIYLESLSQYLNDYPGNHSSYASICIYIDDVVDSSIENIKKIDKKEEWLQESLDSPNAFLWSLHSTNQGTILRQSKCIYLSDDYSHIAGVISIDINVNSIRSIANVANVTGNRLYLVDKNGHISYPYYNYDHIPNSVLSSNENGRYEINNTLMLVRNVKTTGWNLIKTISVADINKKANEVNTVIITLTIIFALLSLAVGLIFIKQFLQPVKRLADNMEKVKAGELKKVKNGPKDGEVATLYNSYNLMVDKIDEEIESNYLSRIREKEAELKALQAQINPHFLYNTLDSINWLALKYNAKDISKMVISLSDMLRLSLNKGRNILTIEDELRQVESYIELQKVRYSDSFDAKFEVEKVTLKRKILKMLLQPIVENAIIHGFEDMESGGLIVIRVKDIENGTYFEVENNGKLVDLEEINKRLNEYDNEELRKGYGIINVAERIKALYGNEYGVSYMIRDNHTVAYFVIPFSKEKNDESINSR